MLNIARHMIVSTLKNKSKNPGITGAFAMEVEKRMVIIYLFTLNY